LLALTSKGSFKFHWELSLKMLDQNEVCRFIKAYEVEGWRRPFGCPYPMRRKQRADLGFLGRLRRDHSNEFA
jgi:hypothetical protein